MQESECGVDAVLYQLDLRNLVKEGTCYKNSRKPNCIDLYLTNSLQNTSSVLTGLSYFHKIVLAIFKTTFQKQLSTGVLYKTPVPETEESLAQMFSCEFCKISKNTFFYRTPPVAASDFVNSKPNELSYRDYKHFNYECMH